MKPSGHTARPTFSQFRSSLIRAEKKALKYTKIVDSKQIVKCLTFKFKLCFGQGVKQIIILNPTKKKKNVHTILFLKI